MNRRTQVSELDTGLSPEQRSRCNASSFKAASPRGDALLEELKSPTVEGATPICLAISACVRPDCCSSAIRSAHGVICPSLRFAVVTCQRPTVTEFRCNPPMENFGDRVRRLRIALGMTQAELGRLSSLSSGSIGDIEQGTTTGTRQIDKLAHALETTAEYLRTGELRPDDTPIETESIDQIEHALLERYRRLSLKDRQRLEDFMAGLIPTRRGPRKAPDVVESPTRVRPPHPPGAAPGRQSTQSQSRLKAAESKPTRLFTKA